ncbi:MAG: Tad domain-containing protein [bacterium]
MKNLLARLKGRMTAFDGNESGAVMLLLMASFLVLFMLALTLYDTGKAAGDKMEVQIAADSAAFSHAVIKSRTMNMISYANIIKRMYFSYSVTYINGLAAMLLVTAAHISQCAKWIPRIKSCLELVENALLIIAETIEAFFDIPNLALIGGGSSRPANELAALELYQQYMFKMTPWWAWVEGVTRSMNNGAMASASWPPPGSSIESVKSFVSSAAGWSDFALGTNIIGSLPGFTNNVDTLPVTRRDRQKEWTTSAMPFNFSFGNSYVTAAADYCLEWTGSMEFLVNTIQTVRSDIKDYEWWTPTFIFLQALGGSLGCFLTNWAWRGNPIRGSHLDWNINHSNLKSENDWLQGTSNVVFAYRPQSGRNSATGQRQKFEYTKAEPGGAAASSLVEGYFGVSKSEIVYKPSLGTGSGGFLGNIANAIGSLPLLGSRMGLQPEPDMWSPRWTARLRPLTLPGEEWGSASSNQKAGFDTVVTDSLPYLAMGSALGFFDDEFTFSSGLKDFFYLWRASRTMTANNIEGLAK